MEIRIVKIGNSRGIRIPKALLDQTKLHDKVMLTIKGDGMIIRPVKESNHETALLSEKTLAKDWDKTKEDDAWAHLQ